MYLSGSFFKVSAHHRTYVISCVL